MVSFWQKYRNTTKIFHRNCSWIISAVRGPELWITKWCLLCAAAAWRIHHIIARPRLHATLLMMTSAAHIYVFHPRLPGSVFVVWVPVSPPPGPVGTLTCAQCAVVETIACGDTGTAPSQSSTLQHLGPLAPIHTTLYLEILRLQTCKLDTAVDTLIAIYTSNYPVLDSNYTRDMDKVQLGAGPWL